MLCIIDCRYFLIFLNFHWFGKIYIFNTVCPETFRQLWCCNIKYAPHDKTLTLFRFENVIWTEISYMQIKKETKQTPNKQQTKQWRRKWCAVLQNMWNAKEHKDSMFKKYYNFLYTFFNPIQRYNFWKD